MGGGVQGFIYGLLNMSLIVECFFFKEIFGWESGNEDFDGFRDFGGEMLRGHD